MPKNIAVLIYPHFSMQEISCLTDALSIFYEKKIDVFAHSKEIIQTEDGFQVIANKTLDEFNTEDYECLILPGMINPLPALYDESIIDFLHTLNDSNLIIAAISSAPLLLAKAGLLNHKTYTSGIWEEMIQYFGFFDASTNLHQPIVRDQNIITAIGFAFREFATATIHAIGLECDDEMFSSVSRTFTKEELTFQMGESNFAEFLEELRIYQQS